MELRRYLYILRRHVAMALVILIAALVAGFFVTSRTKEYQATTTLFVDQKSVALPSASTGQVSQDPILAAELLAVTYAKMVKTSRTADLAASGLPRTARQIEDETTAEPVVNTTLLSIVVKDSNPGVAVDIANAVANSFVGEVQQLQSGPTGADDQPISVFQPASSAPEVAGKLARNLELWGVFGLLAAIALAGLLEYLNLTVRGAADLRRHMDLPVLATVPYQATS
jgi:capsular polysaccharide biosynthesis protein